MVTGREPSMRDDVSTDDTPFPPSGGGKIPRFGGLGNIKMGDTGKILLISALVTLIVLVLMSVVGKGGLFVNKTDFTKNMATVVSALDSTSALAQQAKSNVDTAIQSIPGQVSSQVTQKTSDWETKLTTLSNKLSTLESASQSNTSKIDNLTSKLNTDIANLKTEISQGKSDITSLSSKNTDLSKKITDLEKEVIALADKVKTLENQAVVSSVTVDNTTLSLPIASNVQIATPLIITNSGASDVTVPVKLVIQAPSSVTSISSATMTGTYQSTINGLVVTFTTTAFVPADSTVTFGGIKVTLVYTYSGTLTNFTGQWSKQ